MDKITISVSHNGNLIGVYQTPERLIIETTGSVTLVNPNPSSKITNKIK